MFLPLTETESGLELAISNIIGIEGPYISASKIPTEKPILSSEIAILEVIVDLPTPPLPDAIAITFLIPGIGLPLIWFKLSFGFSTFVLIVRSIFSLKFLSIIFLIKDSDFFLAWSVGLFIVISITTSFSKTTTLLIKISLNLGSSNNSKIFFFW